MSIEGPSEYSELLRRCKILDETIWQDTPGPIHATELIERWRDKRLTASIEERAQPHPAFRLRSLRWFKLRFHHQSRVRPRVIRNGRQRDDLLDCRRFAVQQGWLIATGGIAMSPRRMRLGTGVAERRQVCLRDSRQRNQRTRVVMRARS